MIFKLLVFSTAFLKIFFYTFSPEFIVKTEGRSHFLYYTITKDNNEIGNIKIEKITKDDITEYLFESNAKVKILFYNLKVNDRMYVTFKQNNLLQAKLYRTRNDIVEVNNLTTWNGDYYRLTNKNGEIGVINHPITTTSASLYYSEPKYIYAVFSEKFQKTIPIRNIGNRKYMMILPNGNKVTYSYLNGICSLVEAETDLASLKFILKTNN